MTSPLLLALILAAPQVGPEQASVSQTAAQALARISAQAATLRSVKPDTQSTTSVVAERVSDALRAPDSPDVWQRLADALPALVASDATDSAAVLEAARLALDMSADDSTSASQEEDSLLVAEFSLAVLPPSAPRPSARLDLESRARPSTVVRPEQRRNPTQSPRARGADLPSWLRNLKVADVRLTETEIRFAIWAALSLLAVLFVPRLLRRGNARSEPTPVVRTRLHEARRLAGQGASVADISRETRVAREALTVLLRPPV